MGPTTFLVIIATVLSLTSCQQLPRRFQIPGAIPISGPISEARPIPYRRVLPAPQQLGQQQKLRRPPPPQAAPVRPVIEENNEDEEGPLSRDEVARLQNIPLAGPSPQPIRLAPPQQQHRAQQIEEDEEEEEDLQTVRQYAPPAPIQFRPAPVVRLQQQQAPVRLQQQQAPIRQQAQRQSAPARPRQQQVQSSQDEDGDRRRTRTRAPPVKILRKYRDDNPDGSITWGYENDDGSFKEEVIGIDCVTRGKYGYVDPDGNRREYSYETGLRCDIPQEEELPEEPLPFRPNNNKPSKRPGQPPRDLPPIRLQ